MSAETMEWLRTKIVIGHVGDYEKMSKGATGWSARNADGTAWWSDADNLDNHYDGGVPVQVVRDLMNLVQPVEGSDETVYTHPVTGQETRIIDPRGKKIVRPAGAFGPEDPGAILGTFKTFQIHPYDEWLVGVLGNVLDADLDVLSAGLLSGGAKAWVQAASPELLEVEGYKHRPFVTAASSLDGSMASKFQRGTKGATCDNSLSTALSESDVLRVSIRHSSQSLPKINGLREKLGIQVAKAAENFEAQVKALCATEVNERAWNKFVDAHVPLTDDKGEQLTKGPALTRRISKQDALNRLYKTDPRCAPWAGTAFGVVQTVNTFEHWVAEVRGMDRAGRNFDRVVTGKHDALDATTLLTLSTVLARA